MATKKKILITGATGFIGRNLVEALERIPGYEILTANSRTSRDEIVQRVKQADFVVHAGGVTRTTDTNLFHTGNSVLTVTIISTLEDNKKAVPIIFTSSIHADADNEYGKSKRFSEQRILSYGKEMGTPVYVFRLTNTFGRWAKPNHHSVVATFCYNIAHGLDIQISDPNKEIDLLYIDDLVSCILDLIEGKENPMLIKSGDFYAVNKTYPVTLQKLVDTIRFCKNRKTASVGEFEDRINRTYASYMD